MKAAVAVKTDVGRVREVNEDSYLVEDPLFGVADGMGGHVAGDVASQTAIKIITDRTRDGTDPSKLTSLVQAANATIFNRARQDSALHGMGTTCTLLMLDDTTVHLAHVGDSRAYLFRDGELQQLTEDHTLVQRMVREGRITPEEAPRHPQRSIITRTLGVEPDVDVDTITSDARVGDRYLVCSDGLTSMVDDNTIAEILAGGNDPQTTVDELVRLALDAGGEDNVTVVLIDIVDSSDSPAAAAGADSAPERTPTPSAPPPAPTSSPTAEGPEDVVTPPSAKGDVVGKRGARWGRIVLAVLLVVAIVGAAGYIGVRYLWIERSFFVGVGEGAVVTIYRGVPGSLAGIHLHREEQTTDLMLDELPEFVRDDVEAGIEVASLAAAEQRVEELQQLARDKEFEDEQRRQDQQRQQKDQGGGKSS